MSLSASELFDSFAHAAGASLREDWNRASPIIADELQGLAERAALLPDQLASGELSPAEAESLLEVRQISMENILIAAEGFTLIAVQDALNAGFAAIRGAVNAALPTPILRRPWITP